MSHLLNLIYHKRSDRISSLKLLYHKRSDRISSLKLLYHKRSDRILMKHLLYHKRITSELYKIYYTNKNFLLWSMRATTNFRKCQSSDGQKFGNLESQILGLRVFFLLSTKNIYRLTLNKKRFSWDWPGCNNRVLEGNF